MSLASAERRISFAAALVTLNTSASCVRTCAGPVPQW